MKIPAVQRCKTSSQLQRWLLVTCLAMPLVSCDGGIFGTGDGSDVLTDVDASSPSTDSPNGETTGSTPVGSDTGMDLGTDLPTSETLAFENLQVSGSHVAPLIALLNLSSTSLIVRLDDSTDSLFGEAVPPGVASRRLAMSTGTESLSVIDADTLQPVLRLSPLNLGASSLTSLIARNHPTDNGDGGIGARPAAQVIALPTHQSTADPNVAFVRILQGALLDGQDQPGTMTLVPSGAAPGSTDVLLGTLSAATFGQEADYQVVSPGNYALTDSLSRFTPVNLSFAGGDVRTLVLTVTPSTLLVIDDGAFSISTAD